MNHFDLAQSFVEHCERGQPETLAAEFQALLERLGFRYFACCSHVNPANPAPGAVMAHNYPAVWARVFSQSGMHESDPVLLHAERSALPFFWDAAQFRVHLTPAQREVFAAAGTLGIAHGFTIPVHGPWKPDALYASCSLVPDAGSIDASSYFTAQLLAAPFYEAARRGNSPIRPDPERISLSRRERECLELAAQGKSDCEIGRVLRISESTVRTYIERVMRRVGAPTRAQAIAHALALRLIRFGDVLRVQVRE